VSKVILVGIGTYNRNDLLDNCLQNIAKLIVPNDCEVRVIISDNNPDKSAFCVYEKFCSEFPFLVYYEHEAKKSIGAVRNVVLKKALEINADYVAFLDDDEFPTPEWLNELYKTMLLAQADGATSYPTQLIGGVKQAIPSNYKRRKQGSIRKIFCTNSVIFSTKIVSEAGLWFDENFGLMTGEDVDFSSRASAKGYRFAWCDKELLYDIIPAVRKTMEWKMDRAVNNGYLKIFLARKNGDKDFEKTLYKVIFDQLLFSFLGLLIFWNEDLKNKCILKYMDCFGKLKSIYSTKTYEHYKRT
jgi:GT2 family glycosyltransferase